MRDGVLNINKPGGWTSPDVVARVRSLLKVKKTGHAGTLDPQATGVLPVCFGKGTKVVEYLMVMEKEYRAVMRLGEETDTEDATGKFIRRSGEVTLSDDQVREALRAFVGSYDQLPPLYSAIKVKGLPLYKAARAGLQVDREARRVTIHQIDYEGRSGKDVWFSVVCSKGTYIRTLCADIGRKLAVGAHLLSLCRTRAGAFRLEDAMDLAGLEARVAEGDWSHTAYSLDRVLQHFPEISLDRRWEERACHGGPVPLFECGGSESLSKMTGLVRVRGEQRGLLALAKRVEGGPLGAYLKIEKVLVDTPEEMLQPLNGAKRSLRAGPINQGTYGVIS